jgi:hypothetical protein
MAGRFSGPKDHVLAEIPPETKNDRIPPSRPLIVVLIAPHGSVSVKPRITLS